MSYKRICFVFLSLAFFSTAYSKNKEETPASEELTAPIFKYHKVSSEARYTKVPDETDLEGSHLAIFDIQGEFTLIPKLKLFADLPIIHRNYTKKEGTTSTLGNPYAGVLWEILTGVDRDFPTFAFFEGGAKFPLHSTTAATFKRTDIPLGLHILKEVYYFTLGAHAGYVFKINHDDRENRNHGNEFYSKLSGEIHTGYGIDFSLNFLFRWADTYKDATSERDSQSIFTLTPQLLYQWNQDFDVWLSLSLPLRDARFNDIAIVFGDFETPGLLGITATLGGNYKF